LASSSEAARAGGLALLALALLGLAVAGPAGAKVFHSQQQALALAFPDADRIEKRTYILTSSETEQIESRARCAVESRLVTLHTGWKGDVLLGYAHIDVHTIRTKPEGLMVILDAAGQVRSVRVLAFHEPLDYMPTERWYRQFDGKGLEDGLRPGRDVHGIVGATLSVRTTTEAVRRALAYYEILIRAAS